MFRKNKKSSSKAARKETTVEIITEVEEQVKEKCRVKHCSRQRLGSFIITPKDGNSKIMAVSSEAVSLRQGERQLEKEAQESGGSNEMAILQFEDDLDTTSYPEVKDNI